MSDIPERIQLERRHVSAGAAWYTMDGAVEVISDDLPPEVLVYVRADLYAALEAERDGWEKYSARLRDQRDRYLTMWAMAKQLDPDLVATVERQAEAYVWEGGDDAEA